MKSIVAGIFAAIAAIAVAEPYTGKVYPVPPSKMDEFNARTGGLIEAPSDVKKLVLLDARETDKSMLTNLTAAAESMVSIICEVRQIKLPATDAPSRVAFDAKKNGAGAVILFYEREGDPVLSTFPEDAVSLVNLQPLQDPDYNTYRRRLVKEFWRSLGFALGGYGNPMQLGTSFQPVFSVADLDAVKGFSLSPMHINSMQQVKGRLKLFGRNPVPYSRACREGWAPTPTNSVQKAIYDKYFDPAGRFNEVSPTKRHLK